MAGDDGWTTISSKSKRKQRDTLPYDASRIPSQDPTITEPQLQSTFRQTRQKFRSSSCYQSLTNLFLRLLNQSDSIFVDAAYCLGTGSFSRDNVEQRGRSMLQFVVFLELVQLMKENGRWDACQMFASEPRYTDMDVEFLAAHGVEVVTGEDKFRPNSLVCEFFVEWKVGFLQRFLDDEVGMILGSMRIDGNALAEASKELVRKGLFTAAEEHVITNDRFCQEYQAYYFPRYDEDPNTLEGLKLAIRKPPSDDD